MINQNELALEVVSNLDNRNFFTRLQGVDLEISNNVNPFDKDFYYRKQDQLNELFGELLSSYGILKKELASFLAVRKYQMAVECSNTNTITVNGESIKVARLPGNDLLEDYALAEIPELHKATIGLEKWVERALSSIRTCRSHIYSDKQQTQEEYTKDISI